MTDNVFDTKNTTPAVDTTNITVDVLVGEGQKYASADELAKAYVNADAYIQQAKAKQLELEAELKVLRDIATKVPTNSSNNTDPVNNNPNPRLDENPLGDKDRQNEQNSNKDLSALISEEVEKIEQTKRFQSNVDAAAQKLSEHYGSATKANEAIRQKAVELGVSVDWLLDMAGRSPQALYRTIGIEGAQSRTTPNATTDNGINTNAFGNARDKRNFRYYEEIRKSDPKSYYTPAIQRQMFNDAKELGSSFYNS